MGVTASAQRDQTSPEHAPALEQEANELPVEENLDDKVLQKNGQISISSLSRKSDDQSEENTLAEVGQTDAPPQQDEVLETMETADNEEPAQVNGETEEGKPAEDAVVTATEEDKAAEDASAETGEVGFKKIFRFVGFKFTLKKDKNEKVEPVKLLTLEKKEEETEATTADADGEAGEAVAIATEETPATEEEKASGAETETPAATEPEAEKAEAPAETPTEGAVAEEGVEPAAESATSPAAQETQSPFKRFFTQGIFSNLRKKTSFKKAKEEESAKDAPAGEETKKTEEKVEEKAEEVDASTPETASEGPAEEAEKVEVAAKAEVEAEAEPAEQAAEQEVAAEEAVPEAAAASSEGPEEQQQEAEEEAAVPADPALVAEAEEAPAAITADVQPTQKKAEETPEDQAAAAAAAAAAATEATPEAEIVSSQEKAKTQGSPLKKLFTGAGLKKLSSKKPKAKKETKLTESGEQLQTSTESTDGQKQDSGPSSPEESGEHVLSEVTPAEASQEAEASTSDNEKKRDGILSSFKKLVTPKKRVKRSSESEDEGPAGDKPKSATLSSTESASSAEKADEPKPTEPEPEPTTELKAEEEESAELTTEPKTEEESAEPAEAHQAEESSDVKEEGKEESKTEPKSEKVEPVAEEHKKKMDTSMSWEALICVGTAKKRARKTSDSEDEDTKLEEEVLQSVEEQAKTTESPLGTSQEADNENLASSPEPEGELVSTWESFKRLVTSRKKKSDDKAEDTSGAEQTLSDSEIPKEESSFSLRKLIPRRKRKSDGKQGPVSSDVGSAEEDSDTPAVVPLSEYDNEPAEPTTEEAKDAKPEESRPEAAESAASAKAAAAAEDRSPSWISAAVDDLEEEGKQLSDIPEEVDAASTPKSTDNTIAEDIVELTSEAVTALEQPPEPSAAEETEMVSAVSRISASPATSGEATPVAEVAEKVETVLQEAAQVVAEGQQEVAAATTDSPQSKTPDEGEKSVLVPHQSQEATSICTGLDARALEGAEVETLVPAVEGVSAVAEVIATEMAMEEKQEQQDVADATEDKVYEAEVQEVQTEETPAKNDAEMPQTEEVRDAPETQLATEIEETPAVKVAVVSAPQAEAERLEEPLVEEKLPEGEPEGPAEAATEEDLCSQTAEVTVVAVSEDAQVKELDDTDESVAKAELAPAEEVAEAITEEVTTSLADAPVVEVSEGTEAPIAVLAATEEFAVTKETVCVISSPSETAHALTAEIKDEVVMENVGVAEPSGDEAIQVQQEEEVAAVAAATAVEASVEAVSSEESVVVEEAREEVEEVPLPTQADQAEVEVIEEQSSVIVQTIIQNVMENISEMSKDAAAAEEGQGATETSAEVAVVEETTPETKAEPEVKTAEEMADASAEKAPKTIVQAVQITEVLPVSLPVSIAPVQEEKAVMTVDGIELSVEVPQKDQQQEEELTGSVEEQKADVVEKMEEEEQAEEGERMEEEEKAEVKEEKEEEEEKQCDEPSQVETESEQVTQEAPAAGEPSPAEMTEAESSEAAPEISTVSDGQGETKAETTPQSEAAAPRSSDDTAAVEDSEAQSRDAQSTADVPAASPFPDGDVKAEEPAATVATATVAAATDAPAEIATGQTETPAPAHAEREPENAVNAQEVLEHVVEEAVKEIEPVSTEVATVS